MGALEQSPATTGARFFDASYREEATLADGSKVVLRLVRPSDKEMFVRGLARLSDESRYLRFFTDKRRFTQAELVYLTEVDQERHVALGALRVAEDGSEEGLGVARFVTFADEPDVAEAAVAVIDEMHGKGLGRLLFLRIIAAARERGITRFRAEVLPENTAMRQLCHTLDPQAAERSDGECVVVTLTLPEVAATEAPSAEAGRGPIYRLLRLVAERLVTIRRALDSLIGEHRHEAETDEPSARPEPPAQP
jgi:GNAT superfamily N-acetyltransferase